jgi:hypothetical protein
MEALIDRLAGAGRADLGTGGANLRARRQVDGQASGQASGSAAKGYRLASRVRFQSPPCCLEHGVQPARVIEGILFHAT